MSKNSCTIICRTISVIIFIVFLVGEIENTAKHFEEFCENEAINLEFCPLRPSVNSPLNELSNEAYLVCEDDVLSSCTEMQEIRDKPDTVKRLTTPMTTTFPTTSRTTTVSTTTTTTAAPTTTTTTTTEETTTSTTATPSTTSPTTTTKRTTTTIPIELCPTCFKTCDEERSRCDFSGPIETSTTTIDPIKFILLKNDETKQQQQPNNETNNSHPLSIFQSPGETGQPEIDINVNNLTNNYKNVYNLLNELEYAQNQQKKAKKTWPTFVIDTSTSHGVPEKKNNYPEVLYDALREPKKPKQEFYELKDQLHSSAEGQNLNNQLYYRRGFPFYKRQHRRRNKRSTERLVQQQQQQRRDETVDNNNINPADEEKLVNLYGRDMYNQHKADFINIGNMRQQFEPQNHADHVRIPYVNPSDEFIQEAMNQVRLHYLQQQQRQLQQSQNQFGSPPMQQQQQQLHYPPLPFPGKSKEPITPTEIKRMLTELLERLEVVEMSNSGEYKQLQQQYQFQPQDRCTLNGLWLSAVTGIGIQLQPFTEHDLKLHVVDMGISNGDKLGRGPEHEPIISSEWSGKAVVSTESATTISIVLQEKWINRDKEPKTAVFVGQCVICSGAPTIQGTWIIFPESQTCYEEMSTKVPPRADVMYLLK